LKKSKIRTGVAFIIWAVLLSGAFILTAKFPDAKFDIYAMWLTVGLTAYTGKRLIQKDKRFNNEKTEGS
jgi:hypothetical protein